MSPPIQRLPETDEVRQLETIVLTQVRDSMALINNNMSKMNDKLENLNDGMTRLNAQDFASQITRLGETHSKESEKLWDAHSKLESRVNAQAVQLARFGLGMAISASVGSLALGATIVAIFGKIFGTH